MSFSRNYDRFDPIVYLNEYYRDFPPENVALLRFLIASLSHVPRESLMLEFGCGPTLYTALIASCYVREIHLSEYARANREEVEKWLNRHPSAFDWSATTRQILKLEGRDESPFSVTEREMSTRQRVKNLLFCDASQNPPLEVPQDLYDVLVTNLCIEAVAHSTAEWHTYLGYVTALLKPGGHLIMTTVKGSSAYSVGDAVFHVLPLREQEVMAALQAHGYKSIQIDWERADHPVHNYEGLMFITARKGKFK